MVTMKLNKYEYCANNQHNMPHVSMNGSILMLLNPLSNCAIESTPSYLAAACIFGMIENLYLLSTNYNLLDYHYPSVQNSATFPKLLLKSSKKVVFLSEISSKIGKSPKNM